MRHALEVAIHVEEDGRTERGTATKKNIARCAVEVHFVFMARTVMSDLVKERKEGTLLRPSDHAVMTHRSIQL